MTDERKRPRDGGPAREQAARAPPVVDSRELLGTAEELLIHHEGRLYRLRRTRLGKLILTA